MRHRACLRLLAALLILPALFGGTTAFAAACTDTINPASPVLSDGFAFNASNTRDNVSQINSTNVSSLQLAYRHAAVGSTVRRGVPAVTQQAVFLAEGASVVAINRQTGCTYWTFNVKNSWHWLVGKNNVRSSSIYFLPPTATQPAVVLAGDLFGNYYGVNAQTGKQIWTKWLGTQIDYHQITGSAQVYNGTIYVPVSSREVVLTAASLVQPCCTSHGMVQAVDPYTGSIKWTYNTSPDATKQPAGNMAPNGMSIWGVPAIDPARNQLYVGTGQNLTPPVTGNSDAIIAVDLTTGAQKWVFQAVTNDAWNASCQLPPPVNFHCDGATGHDYDFGAPPILVHLAGGTDAVIAGSKDGVVYSLNPNTGAVNWSRRIGAGAALGGIHWGMATDGQRLYAAVSDVLVDSIGGFIGSAGKSALVEVDGASPGVYALDLSSGNLIWSFRTTHTYNATTYDSIFSAAVSVTNDVVFAGSLDGVAYGLRSTDGKLLWSYNTVGTFTDVNGNAGNGGSIDQMGAVPAGPDLYINSGYEQNGGPNPFQAGVGNGFLVLRLPGN